MATQAFPPTPAQGPPGAPPGGAPKPNPVGTAVSGANPQIGQLVERFKTGLQSVMALSKAVRQTKPDAADKMDQGLAMIMQGIQTLKGGGTPGPTAPQGAVPPPPQMAAESPEPETPEAT